MRTPSAILIALVMAAAPAAAATDMKSEDPVVRIFVFSDSEDLREELGVRHDFGSFFSTNVHESTWLLLQARGVSTEEVEFRQIQCHGGPPPHEGCGGGGGGGGGRAATPDDPTPYGIEQIYDSGAITSTSGGAGIRLGHFDTGVLSTHIDLTRRVVACESTASNDCSDKNGHGTHTAGTAVADGGSDGLGIWGVAPEADLHTVKVCSNGGLCAIDDTIAAIDICIAAGCEVITFSIGGDGASETERAKIQEFNDAGGLFVAAAGNDGSGTCSIDYPGAFKEVVGVGAIDSNKNVPNFSSRGCSADSDSFDEDGELDFTAGGVSVESTYKDGAYAYISGTSMATPHVAGLALKKWAGSRGNTINALLNGVEDLGAQGVDIHTGNGLPHV